MNRKQANSHRSAALRLIDRLDNERPTQVEIWGCPPCEEYPDGLIGLAELERLARPPKAEPVKSVDLVMMPYGFGKLIGSE